MPYGIRYVKNKKGPDKWEIYKKDTGRHVGWSSSEEKAKGSIRAREGAEHGTLKKRPIKRKH